MKKVDTFNNLDKTKLSNFIFIVTKQLSLIVVFVSIIMLNSLYAQQAKVSINKKNVRFSEILSEIESQTTYLFTYNNQVNTNFIVSIDVKKTTVADVLKLLLKDRNIDFEHKGNHIILSISKKPDTNKALNSTVQETKSIEGHVLDVHGYPVNGATISENKMVRGRTDHEGRFIVRVNKDAILSVSSISYEPAIFHVGSENEYNVTLYAAFQSVNEVVVTGYQDLNKIDMVGAYQTIKMADIQMPNYSTIDKMLQGIVPGMIVTNSSSRVGSSPSIQIRGTSTLLGNTSPLWVVDGIIQEDPLEVNASTFMATNIKEVIGNQVSWLNPMDIESITVLKDASATAIYGSKASNGVIVINTKKVKNADRFRINYSASTTVNSKPNYGLFNVMNSQERIQFSDEVFSQGIPYLSVPLLDNYTYEGAKRMFIEGEMSEDEFNNKRTFLETVNTDWFDLLTRNGIDQSHNLSFTGGSEKMSIISSLSFNNQNGQEIGNDGRRYTARVSSTMHLHPKLTLNVALTGGYNETNTFGNGVNPMSYALNTSRSIPAYDEFGDLVNYQKVSSYAYNKIQQTLGYNIITERDNSEAISESMRAFISADLRWNIKPWLSYNFTGGYNHNSSASETTMGENTFYVANTYRGYDAGTALPGSVYMNAAILPFGGEFFTNDLRQKTYNIQNKLSFSWNYDNTNRLNILLGHEVRSATNIGSANTVYGYSKERGEQILRPTLPSALVPTAGVLFSYTGYGIFDNLYNGRWLRTNQTNNFMSVFATAAYSIRNTYVLNMSVRNDISNRFGQDVNKRFDPTYSFGVSYRLGEESFVKENLPELTQMNFRATYGIQGNALANQSPELLLYKQGVKGVFNQYFSTINRIPNPNLSWERTTNWNFGVDMVLFNKISTSVDYYSRKSNAILSQDVPYEFGVLTTNMNGGMLYNSGIEGLFSFAPITKKDLGLNISINASRNWNTAGKPFTKSNYLQYTTGRAGTIIKEGYSVNSFWSLSFAGLDPTNGNAMFNLFDTDKELAKEDPSSYMVYSGETAPSVTGGLNVSLRYKQFTLNTGFAAILGSHTRLSSPYANLSGGFRLPASEINLDRRLVDRWKKPGDELVTNMPSINAANTTNTYLPDGLNGGSLISFWEKSDATVASASFLRARNIDLSWRLHQNFVKRFKLTNVSLTASANNLFVIASSKFQGLDPELKNSVMPKAFSFGINCGF